MFYFLRATDQAPRWRATALALLLPALATLAQGQCFQPVRHFGAGARPSSVAVADFNADGELDLAVANNEDDTVSVLLGNGDGTFGVARNFGVGNSPYFVAVGDFNGDAKPDLATANTLSANVSVLLGNGDGTFGATRNFGVEAFPGSVAVGDFNADGKPDLATASTDVENTVSVLLGNGDGTFQFFVPYRAGNSPTSVAVGDFDVDGNPDLATANSNGANVSVLLGNGIGGFGTARNFSLGRRPLTVAVGDYNADGNPDLVTANDFDDTVSVLLGNGDGTFGVAQSYGVGIRPSSVAVGDFNGDGNPDLAVANLSDDTVSVLLGNGDGTFGAAQEFTVGEDPFSVAVGDFNGDGKPDVVTANVESNDVSVLLNEGTLRLTLTGAPVCAGQPLTLTIGCVGGTYAAELSDADGSFGQPVGLGTVTAGSNLVVIPANTPGGSGYRLRLLDDGLPLDTTAAFLVNAPDLLAAPRPAVTPGRVCRGEALSVTFSTTGTCPFPAENGFTVQLSNATGSFANPTALGTAQPGTTSFALPQNLPVGTGYRVRVVSSSPAQKSSASLPFRVEGPSLSGVTPAVGGVPVCRGQAVTVSFGLPGGSCAFPENNQFTAQLSSATGSFNNPTSLGVVLAGVSNSVTIPAGVGAGAGYRLRVVSSQPALTSAVGAAFRVNACLSRMSAEEVDLVVAPNPVQGREIRLRVTGMDNPAFTLTSSTGRSVGISVKTDPKSSGGEFVLTPRQGLAPGVYAVGVTEGSVRLTRRVLVSE